MRPFQGRWCSARSGGFHPPLLNQSAARTKAVNARFESGAGRLLNQSAARTKAPTYNYDIPRNQFLASRAALHGPGRRLTIVDEMKILHLAQIALLALFIGLGLKGLADQHLLALADTGPDGWGTELTPEASTDAYLKALLRETDRAAMAAIPEPTGRLRTALQALPQGQAILLTGRREQAAYHTLLLLVRQMSWPRPVYELNCEDRRSLPEIPANTNFSAVIWLLKKPPAAVSATRPVLPGLAVGAAPQPGKAAALCVP